MTCEDKDPNVAQAMADYFGGIGNVVFQRVSASSAREERLFLEQRVGETKKARERGVGKVEDFEEQHEIVDLPEQSKAVVSAIASLNGDMLSKELELSYLNSFSSADEATAIQTRQQIAVMKRKLKALEESDPMTAGASRTGRPQADTEKHSSTDRGLFPPALSVPKLRFELAQLYRDQKSLDALYFLLVQRFEMAKVNEARDTSTFQVIDHAALPTKKARPHRVVIILAAFLFSLAGAILLVVNGDRIKSVVVAAKKL